MDNWDIGIQSAKNLSIDLVLSTIDSIFATSRLLCASSVHIWRWTEFANLAENFPKNITVFFSITSSFNKIFFSILNTLYNNTCNFFLLTHAYTYEYIFPLIITFGSCQFREEMHIFLEWTVLLFSTGSDFPILSGLFRKLCKQWPVCSFFIHVTAILKSCYWFKCFDSALYLLFHSSYYLKLIRLLSFGIHCTLV